MPRKLNRKLEKVWPSRHENVEYHLFDTGAFYVMQNGWESLVITETRPLYENSYLDKIIEVLEEDTVVELVKKIRRKRVITFQYVTSGEVFEKILDAQSISPTKKLFGLSSFTRGATGLSPGLALHILEKQIEPDRVPNEFIDQLFSSFFTVDMSHNHTNDYFFKNNQATTEELYKENCRRVSFLKDPRALTYEEYCLELGEEFFIPMDFEGEELAHYLKSSDLLRARIKELPHEELSKLNSKDAIRVIRKNNLYRYMDSELRDFYESRYDLDVEPLRDTVFEVWNPRWSALAAYLTKDEFASFIAFSKRPDSVLKDYQDVEHSAAPFIAYAWIHAHESDFAGLIRHIEKNMKEDEDFLGYISYNEKKYIELDWINPNAPAASHVDLKPYMSALVNKDELDFELKLILS